MLIYKILAGILNLGKITFVESNSEKGCQLSNASMKILFDVAELFNVHHSNIENVLINRSIHVKDSHIRYVIRSKWTYLLNITFVQL